MTMSKSNSKQQTSPQTYQQNLQLLQQISAKLQDSENVDVDELIPLLDQAKHAYAFCKGRLDEVEKALKQRLQEQDDSDS